MGESQDVRERTVDRKQELMHIEFVGVAGISEKSTEF